MRHPEQTWAVYLMSDIEIQPLGAVASMAPIPFGVTFGISI